MNNTYFILDDKGDVASKEWIQAHSEEALKQVDAFEKIEKKQKKDYARSKSTLGLKVDNYQDNARIFYDIQPYFFDKSSIWWIWDENKWKITDDVDMERKLDKELGFYGQTIQASLRNGHLRAMMWEGREKYPKEAPKKWIQFKDKAFSLTSKEIHTVTKDYFFCNPIPYCMGESDATPTIDKLFEDWVGKDYVKSLYEVIAYCCYADYPIQTLICLYGSGRNGKTCFLRLLSKFLGKDNCCSTELDVLLESRFESFKLYKKLCCIMGETNFGVFDKSSMFKKLTGGDMIGFEKKGKDPFNEFSYAKLIIASNSLPSSNDTSEGFYRRWFIIDFPNEFSEGKDILVDIPEQEYSNLARKCMNLLPGLLERGHFDKQGTIEERKTKYILSSNPLPFFLENCCIRDSFAFISYSELYTHYVSFLTKNKKRIVKQKEFRDSLTQEGIFIEKTSKMIDNEWKSGYFVIGIRIKDDFMTIMTIMTDFYTLKNSHVGEMEKQSQLSQLSRNPPKEEQVQLYSFETYPKDKEFVPCAAEGCRESPCKRDKYDVPYCKIHFEEMGSQ